MGRRKIEIKAIKDDRNRSVTFLKRKGGLFKKAHELSVLCSVDVAVFIFGNNKKLYEYSSTNMGDLITRYQYHGGANEHKGPSDFNGGNDDDEDEDGDASPPQGPEGLDHGQMPPPQFHGQQAPFPQIRHHTPSASPPIGNGVPFGHPGHATRGHTPQPPNMGSRPSSRNDSRRAGPGMVPQPGQPVMAYMPTPPIYNPQPGANQPGVMPQQAPQYQYQVSASQNQHHQQPQPQHAYTDDRRPPPPPAYPHGPVQSLKPEPSPPLQQAHHQNIPRISVSPQPERRFSEPQPPPPIEPKSEPHDRPQPPLLKTDAAIKKLPQRKSHSIFTPVEENRSILSQHLASFQASDIAKSESGASIAAAAAANRASEAAKARTGNSSSPPQPQRTSSQSSLDKGRPAVNTEFAPPARTNSLRAGGPGGGAARPRGPPLTLQIPADETSEAGGSAVEDSSPRPPLSASNLTQRHNSHSSVVLPPPSPSGASAILSAGATGPPNPFARPPPQQGVNGETPVSALPSRFLNHEFLPSPSSFYPEWNYRGSDSNTLPSPLNFATPVAGAGPSFLRDDTGGSTASNTAATSATAGSSAGTATTQATTVTAGPAGKRKSPDYESPEQGAGQEASEAKRLKV